MRSFRKISLKHKITALILAASCVVLFLSSSIFVATQVVTYKRLTVVELRAAADIVANNVTAAVVFDDPESALETLSALRAKPGTVLARIYRQDGTLFTEFVRPGVEGAEGFGPAPEMPAGQGSPSVRMLGNGETTFLDHFVDVSAPINLDGERIGTIMIRSDLKQTYDIINAHLVLGGFVVMFLIVVAFMIAARLQKVVSAPILSLVETMQQVSVKQDYSARASKYNDDELGQLAEQFNAMLNKIQAHDEHLRAAWQEAEAASRAKTEFLANMSHELRTPLNAIIGFSEIIQSELLGPLGTDRYRQYAQDIHESGQHLLEVINDILDISKVEAGEFELQDERSDLVRIFDQSVRLVRERAAAAGLDVVVEAEADLPSVVIDRRLIKQGLINLLSNAVKFSTGPGAVLLRARRAADGSIRVSITDHGIGIAEEDIPRILQPFSQVESAFSRKHEGTGLGLPLAKSFIEAHGGSLEIKSKLGAGTTVTMHFPAARVVASRAKSGSLPAAG